MNVLFVCTGNTCRSPMAEGYLKHKNIPDVFIKSRGLAANGEPASKNATAVMREKGMDISGHISSPVTSADLAAADIIICMSPSHITALAPFVNREKLCLLGDGIPDPYGSDTDGYRICRDAIFAAVDTLINNGAFTVITVQKLKREQIKDIAEIEKVCFSSPWSAGAIEESFENGTEFFVALSGGTVVGYAGINTVIDEGYITNIAVLPQFRKKGAATALLARLDSLASDMKLSFISLEVRQSNFPAISLYEKSGYKQEGLRKGFYNAPKEDALIMTKRY